MKIIDTISELENQLQGYRHKGETIGLVPTMGALHQGHASLVERCVADNKISIVSLFVNPTQFNNKEDLKHYPRTPEKDHELLERLGVDYVFHLLLKRCILKKINEYLILVSLIK